MKSYIALGSTLEEGKKGWGIDGGREVAWGMHLLPPPRFVTDRRRWFWAASFRARLVAVDGASVSPFSSMWVVPASRPAQPTGD